MFSSLILVTEAITCKASKHTFLWGGFYLCHLYLLRRLKHCFQSIKWSRQRHPGPSPEQTEPPRAAVGPAGLCTSPATGGFGLPTLPPGRKWLFCALSVTLNYSLIALPKEVGMSHSLLLISCHYQRGKRWENQGQSCTYCGCLKSCEIYAAR